MQRPRDIPFMAKRHATDPHHEIVFFFGFLARFPTVFRLTTEDHHLALPKYKVKKIPVIEISNLNLTA